MPRPRTPDVEQCIIEVQDPAASSCLGMQVAGEGDSIDAAWEVAYRDLIARVL